jgi:hypothetical protein
VVEKPIKGVEHLLRIVAMIGAQITERNEPANFSDAQLDPEIDQSIASPLSEASHALCRRFCITRNVLYWLVPMRSARPGHYRPALDEHPRQKWLYRQL